MSETHCNESDTNTLSTLSESFNNSILEKIRSSTATCTFVVQAEQDVSSLREAFTSGRIDRNMHRPSTVDKDICPDAVLEAMLAHAIGGNDDNEHTPRRYVACAIATAGQDNNFEQLIDLANTWVRYLFWPFKANTAYPRNLHSEMTEVATPTLRETLDSIEGARPVVKGRDGYRCIVTRFIDRNKAPPDSDEVRTTVEAAHIFKRAVAAGKRTEKSLAEYATWDILRHLIGLSEEQVAELDTNIDYVYNGITLDQTLHSAFDGFEWSLRPDPDHLNRYYFDYFTRKPPSAAYGRNIEVISFEGCPAEVRPSRKLIQFHYSLAKVLHASGAGRVIESMLKRFFEGGRKWVTHECMSADDLELYLSTERMSLMSL
ncbi:uncharacterized protein EV420DRAFT_1641436 [Desarmillaria tabescens]|uniref:HNH nuclease domain-containing protein n=1 Tax=Armillaria tabescens TaxID=1929756 RepID=A0AA39N7A8_ARMTA|nr:uncharacterized protein EV420DRAFT_1641436 [Desarmillaria tabescens]KAK0460100.1 hypothetical protein EV420DRAFT_1641436 [Desarmillaria tabescens]